MTMLLHFVCAGIGADSLTGRITDGMQRGVAYANVVLLSLPDSAFVTGTVSGEDGTFTLAASPSGEGVLKFSCLGYATRLLPLSGFSGEIVLQEDHILLHDVEVVAERPVYRQKDGALVTRVEGTVLSEYHRMDDLLATLPGMAPTASGDLEVFGLGTPIVYINNRKAQADELKQLTPKDIRSVELLTNPGARYDADGKAVLKVSTVTNRNRGRGIRITKRSAMTTGANGCTCRGITNMPITVRWSTSLNRTNWRWATACICIGIPTSTTSGTRSSIRGTQMPITNGPPVIRWA